MGNKQAKREQVQSAILFSIGVFGFSLAIFIDRQFFYPFRISTYIYRAVVLGLAILFILQRFPAIGWERLGKFWIPFFVFWALYGLRMLHDIGIGDQQFSRDPSDFYLLGFGACMIPAVAFGLLRLSPRNSRLVFQLSLTILTLALGAVLYYSRDSLGTQFGRLQGDEGLNPITLGHLGASLVILSCYALISKVNPTPLPRVVYLLLSALGLFGIAVASSRSPILALIVCLALMIYFGFRQGRQIPMLLAGIATVLLGVWIFGLAVSLGSNVDDRVAATVDKVESGEEARLFIYETAIDDFLRNPLTGHSLEGSFGFYPHNLVIESFMALGILGGGLFIWLVALGVIASIRLLRYFPEYAWMAVLYFQMLVYANFSGALWGQTGFWCMLCAVVPFLNLSVRSSCVPVGEKSLRVSSASSRGETTV